MTNVPNQYANMTVAELVERYLEYRMPVWLSKPRGEANARTYRTHTVSMLKAFGTKTLGELCQGDELRNLCLTYATRRDVLPSTVVKQLGSLQSALIWAWEQRWITGLPPMYLPPSGDGRQRVLSADEIETLLNAANSYPTERQTKFYVHLALLTPATKSAICDLTWDRVDFDKGLIHFDGRAGQPRLKVEMTQKLREILMEAKYARVEGCKHVLHRRGKPIQSAYQGLKALLKRANLENITINDLRLWSDTADDFESDAHEGEDESSRIIISYCTHDGMSRAATLCEELEVLNRQCWIAPRDVKAGPWAGQIIEAIESGEALAAVITPKANDSTDVLQEVNAAQDAGKIIIPVIVGNTVPAPGLRYYLGASHQIPWTDAASVAASIVRLLKADNVKKAS